jgi:hypothetical protein
VMQIGATRERKGSGLYQSLCKSCGYMREVVTRKGSRVRLCLLSLSNPRFPKYPAQPIVRCRGFRQGDPSLHPRNETDLEMQINLDEVFERLSRSDFRRRFHLGVAEMDYLRTKGLDAVLQHGERFIEQRLAPADIPNDGKQTPMRKHPIFVAQHATATCCRGCLEKWHSIPKGHDLTSEEKAYILSVLRRWLLTQRVLEDRSEPSA